MTDLLPGAPELRRAYARRTELSERHLDGVGDLSRSGRGASPA